MRFIRCAGRCSGPGLTFGFGIHVGAVLRRLGSSRALVAIVATALVVGSLVGSGEVGRFGFGVAHAESAAAADSLARAKNHYMAGNGLFKVGNYTDAVREFAAGYALVPKPYFLYNLGQCYRKLGDLRRARDMYAKFVEQIPESDPDRDAAKKIVAELDEQIAKLPPETVKPTNPPQTTPEVGTTTNALVTTTVAPPPKKSFIKKHWWIIPVSAVVVGGAVGVGVYFGTRPPSQVGCSDAGVIGCVSAK